MIGMRASVPTRYSRRVHLSVSSGMLLPAAILSARYLATAAQAASSDSGQASAIRDGHMLAQREVGKCKAQSKSAKSYHSAESPSPPWYRSRSGPGGSFGWLLSQARHTW